MAYSRTIPRSRTGTTGISDEWDITASDPNNDSVYINPPDRVSALSIAVHFPAGVTGEFKIECSCNRTDILGAEGSGGYWDTIETDIASYTSDKIFMLTNVVTGVRVKVLSGSVNVAICG